MSFFFLAFLTPPGEASWWCYWWRGPCFLLGNWSQWAATWLCLHLNPASLENLASQTLLASLAGPAVILQPKHTSHSLVKVLHASSIVNTNRHHLKWSAVVLLNQNMRQSTFDQNIQKMHCQASLLDLNASLATLALIYMLDINVSTGALVHVHASHSMHTEN